MRSKFCHHHNFVKKGNVSAQERLNTEKNTPHARYRRQSEQDQSHPMGASDVDCIWLCDAGTFDQLLCDSVSNGCRRVIG